MNAVFARPDGTVLDLPASAAIADGGVLCPAAPSDFIPLPPGSLLLTLPSRSPIGRRGGVTSAIHKVDGEAIDAVSAALPLGYTRTLLPAYEARAGAPALPLYGYAAVAWDGKQLRAAAVRTDELETWDPKAHADERVRRAIAERLQGAKGNALLVQLATCATTYGCFTAQNVFLRRGEAAIPVSPACNARCIGCISEQEPESGVPSAQTRVRRTPSVDEIVGVALAHLEADPRGIVSFGQGCEGEPLLAAPRIAQAIERIRAATSAGTLHCNTNASRPKALASLLDAGLQSIRVSLNSARPRVYEAYYRPQGYSFDDVRASLALAAERGASVSLNLLTHPGITDDPDEVEALAELLERYAIGMVQTRTLNVDPAVYFAAVGRPVREPIGMRSWLQWLGGAFPNVRVGNFTRGFG